MKCPNCAFDHSAMLTGRECEVLALLLTGAPHSDIAGQLNITARTVATFWLRIRHKLGVENINGAYRKYITNRMLTVPDMDKCSDYRDGYARALADILTPDMALFNG